jgi:hypothetical protein
MIKRILILALLALPLVLQAAAPGATQSSWVYLQSCSNLRISIETYQAREGWTPVIVSVAGAEVSAVMDGQGRVVHAWAKGLDKRSLPLFTIELEKGRILLGREAHAIRVYEQNGVRTRFEIAEGAIALPLSLGQGNKAGTLRFGGLEIPARVNVINPTRTTVNKFNPQAVVAAPLIVQKGHGAEAQLTPSRIRARGK